MISNLSLEEKAALCSGASFWETKEFPDKEIPKITMSDGPYGLRKQSEEDNYLDFNTAQKQICFPSAAGMGASFNRELWYKLGSMLGQEARALGVDVLLGPAMNIKRLPIGGRNFEYISEDPLLTARLAEKYVKGVQSQGTSACVKHFAANNQESRRMDVSANIDERTLHEIYLKAFEEVVKVAKPDSIMCSYNRINGQLVSESKHLLNDILREDWKFDGAVISDWGAVGDRVQGIRAGLDLEMPSCNGVTDRQIVEAVKSGELSEEDLDRCVNRILQLIQKHKDKIVDKDDVIHLERDHEASKELIAESIVLLKNKDNVLPLKPGQDVLVVGEFAKHGRYQGGGSSHINSWKVSEIYDSLAAKPDIKISYEQGYSDTERNDEALLNSAISAAKGKDAVVIVAGLPDAYESESYDRTHMMLPKTHSDLIKALSAVNPNIVVILQNGSPIEMPWIDKAKGIVEMYLAGEAGGEVMADVLTGEINPSGHLAETFPIKLEHAPGMLTFERHANQINYLEEIYVGYRYYLKAKQEMLFPFGYGLSYTSFEYDEFNISTDKFDRQNSIRARVKVRNTGERAGKALVQLYIAPSSSEKKIDRPIRELKGFEKVFLKPGESKVIEIELQKQDFSYYDVQMKNWYVESGPYLLQVCEDCEHVMLEKEVMVICDKEKQIDISRNTLVGDFLECERTYRVMEQALPSILDKMGVSIELHDGKIDRQSIPPFVYELPLRTFIDYTNGQFTEDDIDNLLHQMRYPD